MAVGNGPAYAGGMHITPNASMHDGLLDVTVIGALSKPAAPLVVPARVQGHTRDASRRRTTFRGEHIELEALDADASDGRLRRRRTGRTAPGDDGRRARTP